MVVTNLVIPLLAFLTLVVQSSDATLFQNFARDMARNQALHILRHHPDLWNEVVRFQQMQSFQQQQQQLGLNQQNSLNNGNGQQLPLSNQQQQLGLGGSIVMGGNNSNLPQQNKEPRQPQSQMSLDELVRHTSRFPNQRFEV